MNLWIFYVASLFLVSSGALTCVAFRALVGIRESSCLARDASLSPGKGDLLTGK